jgi:hypothetical protein
MKKKSKAKKVKKHDVAMQTRCLHCLREQYAMAVWDISTKGGNCVWCGGKLIPMPQREYNKQLEIRKKEVLKKIV